MPGCRPTPRPDLTEIFPTITGVTPNPACRSIVVCLTSPGILCSNGGKHLFRKIAIHLAAATAVTAGALVGFTGPAAAAEGPYVMQPYDNDYCLHTAGYSANAVAVEQNLCASGSNRNWTWTKSNAYWKIRYRNGGKCIAVAGDSTANNAKIKTQTCHTTPSEQWLPVFNFKANNVDYYQLKNRNSGKCMAITSNSQGADLIQTTCGSSTKQSFTWNKP